MSLGEVKKELKKLDKDQIINIISDLYNKNKSVKEYLEFFLNPNEATILKEYKTKVFESFYPKRGFGYKLNEGKKAINDFKKLGTSKESVSDLMLFYVESGIKFTNDFGDINESFYNSLATTYHQALQIMRVEGVLEKFEDRAGQIIKNTENIGWGFHDYLFQVFCDYYPDEYDDEE